MSSSVKDILNSFDILENQNSPLLNNIHNLPLLKSALLELDQMVEMDKVKESIVLQIKFLLVNSESNDNLDGHMLHTVISGFPGTGKTKCATILAKIWTAIGLFSYRDKEDVDVEIIIDPIDNKIEELEKQIVSLNNLHDLKNETIKNLQLYLINLKSEIKKNKHTLQMNNFKLRKLLNMIPDKNIFFNRLCSQLIRENIKSNQDVIDDIKIKSSTFISDENIHFTLPIPPPIPSQVILTSTSSTEIDEPPNFNKQLLIETINSLKSKMLNKNTIPKHMKKNKQVVGEVNLEPKSFDMIRIVGREDFVGGYLGQTALKTEKLLKDSLGKVLFIDEAYGLVNDEKDSYGREALTVLNRFMSEHSHELVVIFAGYKDMMEKTIFHFQPGLKRRCSWSFDIEGYTEKGLSEIFLTQLTERGWKLSPEVDIKDFFLRHKDQFTAYGGDTLRLAFYCKICYSGDIFNKSFSNSKVIDINILEKAIKYMKEYKIKGGDDENVVHHQMYL